MVLNKTDQNLWNLYIRTFHCFRVSNSKIWIDSNLTMPQIKVLIILAHKGKLKVSSIAKILNVKTPNITFILDHLNERGLIKRKRSQDDRRLVQVSLTEKASRLIDKLYQAKSENFIKALSRMSAKEKYALKQGLIALENACQVKSRGD